MNSFRAAVCLTLLLFVGSVAHAEKTDQLKPQGYVNDFAGVLSASAKAQLTALCTEVDQKAHAQIAVVTVKSLDGHPVEDFTLDLATKWGVGPKQSASGVMILIATEDRKSRVEVGYGLEPILPDGKVGGFLREAVPMLRNNDYDGALSLVTRRIADVIAADRGVTLSGSAPLPARRAPPQDTGWSIGQILLVLFIIFVVYWFMKGSGGGRSNYTRGGGSGWW
ncbi:MAG: TPM domain-containing protein, partial [Candidatus Acidiferrales bacterium]